GTPKTPLYAAGTGSATVPGTPYAGRLKCFSVFGTIKTDGSPFTAADCPGGDAIFPPGTAYWDSNRQAPDRTGFIKKILDFMPRANYFSTGDGLNTAGIRWLRGNNANQGGLFGVNTAGLQTGTNINSDRKQINIKIDENFSVKHKASVGYTYEVSGGGDFL